MPTMVSEVYAIFRDVCVSEEKTRKAAEAMNSEAVALETNIVVLQRDNAILKCGWRRDSSVPPQLDCHHKKYI